MLRISSLSILVNLALVSVLSTLVGAQTRKPRALYDSGATDQEIKIGNIAPYTGAFKEYGAVAKAEAAYFKMINDRGGINGRKINFLTRDSGSDDTTALAPAQELVEREQVLLLFAPFGTEANLAIRAYLNEHKIPQLFVQSSSTVFNDPAHFPWTMGFYETYRVEGLAYAKYVAESRRDAKIAILYPDDEIGKEYLAGVHDGLGSRTSMIVKEVPYRTSDRDLGSQIDELKASGADVFLNFSVGRFATLAIRRTYDLGWHPLQFIPNASLSVAAFLDPAGLQKAAGVITSARSKGWQRPDAGSDPAVRAFLDWMEKYNPDASLRDQNNVAGYERAEALVEVLKRCGDNLTRANVMKQASNLDLDLGMLHDGIRVKTSPTDYQPIKQLFLIKFNGKAWVPFGAVIGG